MAKSTLASRSKRTPKPTEKYIHFRTDGLNNGNIVKRDSKFIKNSKIEENPNSKIAMFDRRDSKMAFKGFVKQKKVIPSVKKKITNTNKVNGESFNSSQTINLPSSKIRRSSREPKTNLKLKEYVHASPNLKDNFFAGFNTADDLTISPRRSSQIKVAQSELELKHEGNSNVVPSCSSTDNVNFKSKKRSRLHGRRRKFPKLNGISKNLENHIKKESMMDVSSSSNICTDTLPSNVQSNLISSETSPIKSTSSGSNSRESKHSSLDTDALSGVVSAKNNPEVRLINREIPGLLHSKGKEKLTYNEMQSQLNSSKTTIRDSLKKFLVMGTKVANVISETLKHNEEELLSSSSAFEKKCMSIVQVLAASGKDLEEGDMEKILTLLDEEQEERKAYRQAFLESLRISHLTNMALYSQMLRLLKTL